MKKNMFLFLITVLLVVNNVSAATPSDWMYKPYVALTGEMSWPKVHKYDKSELQNFSEKERFFKSGGAGTIALGLISECWRLEVEGGYRENKLDKDIYSSDTAEVESPLFGRNRDITLMVNLLYDLPVNEFYGIYIGGGAGLAFKKINFDDSIHKNFEKKLYAGQFMTGVFFPLSKLSTFTLGYRFYTTEKFRYDNDLKSKNIPCSHNAELGLRIVF